MYTGVLYKGNKSKLWNLHALTFFGNINFIRQPVTKPVLLQLQICLNKAHFFFNRCIICIPFHILPFKNSKTFYHRSCFIFFFQDTMHTDTFQYVKQKMGINLTV